MHGVFMVGTVRMSECDSGEGGVYRQEEEEAFAVSEKPQLSSVHRSLLTETS